MTSSPKWLITLTAILPVSGLSNGLEMLLFNVAQASWLISDLRVVSPLNKKQPGVYLSEESVLPLAISGKYRKNMGLLLYMKL
jgi:hypothetical protein